MSVLPDVRARSAQEFPIRDRSYKRVFCFVTRPFASKQAERAVLFKKALLAW